MIVVVSLGLIAWRGDRLRSPGAIDSPISREGAFLANNVMFTVFAFVVLLGTIFPLLVEAFQDRRTVVGAPYFDRLSMPLGLVLLFLMGVAPVLPWRKASGELLRERLFWPAWMGAGAIVLAVVVGADGWAPLVAFGFGGFAAGSAAAPVDARHPPAGLARPRRSGQRRHGRAHRRDHHRRRARGLEQLHALRHAAARNRAQPSRGAVTRSNSRPVDVRTNDNESKRVLAANVVLDGGDTYRPATTTYLNMGVDVGTPSVRTGLTEDIYLTLDPGAVAGDSTATIRVVRQADDPVALDRRLRSWRSARCSRHSPAAVVAARSIRCRRRWPSRNGSGIRPTRPAEPHPDVDGETVPV